MDESLGIHGSHQDEKVFVKPIDILKACEGEITKAEYKELKKVVE